MPDENRESLKFTVEPGPYSNSIDFLRSLDLVWVYEDWKTAWFSHFYSWFTSNSETFLLCESTDRPLIFSVV